MTTENSNPDTGHERTADEIKEDAYQMGVYSCDYVPEQVFDASEAWHEFKKTMAFQGCVPELLELAEELDEHDDEPEPVAGLPEERNSCYRAVLIQMERGYKSQARFKLDIRRERENEGGAA